MINHYCLCYLIKQYVRITVYLFRFYYKIICLSLKLISGTRAYPSLARGYGPGLETCGPGPNVIGLSWAWA